MTGFGSLPCPKCLEDATISLNLADMDTCKCDSCEEEFTLDNIRDIMKKWAPVLKWLDAAPKS